MKRLYTLIFLAFLLGKHTTTAQNLAGVTGLLTIPSANFQTDKTLFFGGSFLHKNYLNYGNNEYNAWAGYVNLTFLPFAELSFRYTGQMREISKENNNFPDRMPSVRLRIIKESTFLPSIALGFQDFTSVSGGNRYFGSEYIVASKNVVIQQKLTANISVGYGFDFINASYRELSGLFYGMSLNLEKIPQIALIVDYDSRNWNGGVKLLLFDRLQLLATFREFKTFEGAISYQIHLK